MTGLCSEFNLLSLWKTFWSHEEGNIMEETYLERDQVISKYHGSLVHFKRVFVIYQFMLQCLMEMLKKFWDT